MLCEKYDDLMMRYMDGILDLDSGSASAEEIEFREHMKTCAHCAEDFAAYSGILQGFSEMEIVEAPEGFAAEVMSKVTALDLYGAKAADDRGRSSLQSGVYIESYIKGKIIDGIIFGAWVLVAVVLAGGASLAFWGAEILAFAEGAGLYGLASFLTPIADFLGNALASLNEFAGGAFSELSHQSMIIYSLSLLLVFVVLVVLQINMNTSREKVKNYG